ncbi:1-acyl-sn-glycerol-3-phosphate acyltransferase [Sphaerisporangium melleum]|uniref:1-acyl-sn-glycerol-3-phosphate acyltransferase n=1 Tax=Sphaerisporangium melleum TaxID=321316 RepID=A0A917VNK3_9ACTN|nr:lysophospholipid acyltransferase family protein [Sphaerisporangium melleum]GGK98885.1 1-acyl-sn-glycerol-3-phosphate acyltransferase [Sphaerisporangium melleum]GII73529.1 1-acyl-sn-glycerol-3-phosphate acyltransferase [Sphaerisporangium melleum]
MSGWVPVAPCSVESCVSPAADRAGTPLRTARLAGAVLVVLAGLPCALVARLTGWGRPDVLTMLWARAFLRALGVRVVVRRRPPVPGGAVAAVAVPGGRGALIVANHISWLDPMVVAATAPCLALAKSEIARWPLVRSLVAGSGAIFIDRERMSTLPATVREVADALRAGRSVVAFPEGTTWCGRSVGPFRRAVFQAAIDASAPVTPVALRYRDGAGEPATAAAFVGDDTLIASLVRVVSAKGLVAEVTVFPDVPHEGGVTRRALAGLAQAVVLEDEPRYAHLPVAA